MAEKPKSNRRGGGGVSRYPWSDRTGKLVVRGAHLRSKPWQDILKRYPQAVYLRHTQRYMASFHYERFKDCAMNIWGSGGWRKCSGLTFEFVIEEYTYLLKKSIKREFQIKKWMLSIYPDIPIKRRLSIKQKHWTNMRNTPIRWNTLDAHVAFEFTEARMVYNFLKCLFRGQTAKNFLFTKNVYTGFSIKRFRSLDHIRVLLDARYKINNKVGNVKYLEFMCKNGEIRLHDMPLFGDFDEWEYQESRSLKRGEEWHKIHGKQKKRGGMPFGPNPTMDGLNARRRMRMNRAIKKAGLPTQKEIADAKIREDWG